MICSNLLHSQQTATPGGRDAGTADRVTRVAADLVDSAAAEGARQSRSAKQQLDHWARVGRAVSSQQTAARRRVESALAGELELGELSVEEGVVFNAEIAAAIQEGWPRRTTAGAGRARHHHRGAQRRPGTSSSTAPMAPRPC